MNKKGELTTSQIVTLVILIVGFAIVLIFLFRLNLGQISNKEICHNSVVLNSKSTLGSTLNCKSSYVCVSGGEDCENFVPDTTMEINASDENETFKIIADEMASCWWMFGEGEANFKEYLSYSEGGLGDHCAICSVMKFDSEVQEKLSIIDYDRFYNYLANTKKDGGETYLKYLYGHFILEEAKLIIRNESLALFGGGAKTENKFWILMGVDPELGEEEADDYVYPVFVNSEEVSSKTSCDNFDLTYP
jgi:hypothetical protein